LVESASADGFKNSVGKNAVTGSEIAKRGANLFSNLRRANLNVEPRQQVQMRLLSAGIANQIAPDFIRAG
jgi:hypothetical protein